jgi:folate-binding protein YgfZ
MKTEWKEFLTKRGAEISDGQVEHFGNPERELRVVVTGNVLIDLSHTGLIAVRGEDAQNFLQGQFTNDIRQVSQSKAQISAFCTPKGRMLSSFLIFQRGDSYYLRMPRELVEATLKRLQMFVLMSKVQLEDASDNLVSFGVSGPDAEEELATHFTTLPQEAFDAIDTAEMTLIRLPGIQPRFEVHGTLQAMEKLWSKLDVHAAPVGAHAWELLDIRAGLPSVFTQTVDAFVPQMVNLQVVGGVSFKKGCYTGQEIVARMQYLGKLKRRMFLAHIDDDSAPVPGSDLFSPDSSSGQGSGKVVSAQRSPEGGVDLLAVIEISSAEQGNIRIGDENGPLLLLQELPYPVELE